MKKTVVFDFDGVIHSYTSGWKGESVIADPPVPRIKEAISDIRLAGYEVVVVSTRCATKEGHGAVRAWLIDNEIEVDAVKTEKPPAVVYIDDRAICFDGNPDNLLNKIIGFEPWYKNTVKTNADRIRAMSDEELAKFMADRLDKRSMNILGGLIGDGYAPSETLVRALHEKLRLQWLEWLKQPAK